MKFRGYRRLLLVWTAGQKEGYRKAMKPIESGSHYPLPQPISHAEQSRRIYFRGSFAFLTLNTTLIEPRPLCLWCP
jgi:hypothetical protein